MEKAKTSSFALEQGYRWVLPEGGYIHLAHNMRMVCGYRIPKDICFSVAPIGYMQFGMVCRDCLEWLDIQLTNLDYVEDELSK